METLHASISVCSQFSRPPVLEMDHSEYYPPRVVEKLEISGAGTSPITSPISQHPHLPHPAGSLVYTLSTPALEDPA